MLNVNYGLEDDLVANGDDTDDTTRVETSVFELAGQDNSGLLADVTQLLTTNGCNVRSAAVGRCDVHACAPALAAAGVRLLIALISAIVSGLTTHSGLA